MNIEWHLNWDVCYMFAVHGMLSSLSPILLLWTDVYCGIKSTLTTCILMAGDASRPKWIGATLLEYYARHK